MKSKGKYYLTTAIAYTSGKPHIGNTYEIILADAIVRYKKRDGYDTYFQTGTDEHGQKIEIRAIEDGCASPKEFVDRIAGVVKGIWDGMNTDYDRFIRTTDADHEQAVQHMFRKFYEQGDIYKGAYEGMYCRECEAFYTESQLTEEGKCPECGHDVHPAKEEAYFFKMSKYADRLIEHINTHPEFIQPVSRKNEMMNNFLLPGLQDLCVSRTSFKWGIPVDFDEDHVIYVWLDALSNYATGIGYDTEGRSTEQYKKLWPADLHLIGKDIIRFHTIYWPIFLMALGEPLPKQIFGHPWLLQGGEKMSKSKGNVIYADDLASVFGVDAVRYFVLHEMPYENDGVITWELMAERFNSDLANTLGNLVNRTVAMTNKYFDGVVCDKKINEPVDKELEDLATACYEKVEKKMEELRVADALTEIFSVFKRCNKYIDETEPWLLAKEEDKKDRLATVLYHLVEAISIGTALLEPFMPETAAAIMRQLGCELRDFETLGQFGLYPDGGKVTDKPEILFVRKDLNEVLEQAAEITKKQKADFIASQKKASANLEKAGMAKEAEAAMALALAAEGASSEASGQSSNSNLPLEGKVSAKLTDEVSFIDLPSKPEITYDQFDALQFRIGEVIACEEVPKSKKLLLFKVQVGSEVRQIVSGIKKWYKPEDVIGKKVMVLANLKPATLAGIESQGMLLSAEDADGNVCLMTPEKDMPAGAGIS